MRHRCHWWCLHICIVHVYYTSMIYWMYLTTNGINNQYTNVSSDALINQPNIRYRIISSRAILRYYCLLWYWSVTITKFKGILSIIISATWKYRNHHKYCDYCSICCSKTIISVKYLHIILTIFVTVVLLSDIMIISIIMIIILTINVPWHKMFVIAQAHLSATLLWLFLFNQGHICT